MTIKGNIDHMIDVASFKAQVPHLSQCARYITAGSPWTPRNVLAVLACDPLDQIRLRVAENSNTSVAILEQLAFDTNPDVRLAAVENVNAPKILTEILAKDTSDDVRFGIAESYRAPEAVLNMLTADDNPYVAHRAAKTLKTLLLQLRPAA